MNIAMLSKRILIIGAGPTGLGAAYEIQELGYKNWNIYEKENKIGGLASSFKDNKSFLWDLGGHVMFSRNKRFNKLVDFLMGDEFISHERKSFIRIMNKWIPYPFQNNIRYLPKALMLQCLSDFIKTYDTARRFSNFEEWITGTFGKSMAEIFFMPYNSKTWAVPLNSMSYDWIRERISIVDAKRLLRNIQTKVDDTDWGPNNKFKFPLFGGTGGFFGKFEKFVSDKIFYNKKLVSVDARAKTLRFSDGSKDKYDILINTSPLDVFVKMLKVKKQQKAVLEARARKLKYNSIFVVGIGLKKKIKGDKCWVYFPEKNIPFNRMTYFSYYSPNNVPCGDARNYSSLMCEVSFSKHKPVNEQTLIGFVVKGLVKSGILSKGDLKKIVSVWSKKVDYAYPIPTLDRDDCLAHIQCFLENKNIYSRGRFGAWKYEIGNMDHSVLMGIEVIEKIFKKKKEKIWSL